MSPLVTVRNLKKYYPIRSGLTRRRIGWLKAVEGVSFTIKQGETLGLVGESGCGKTTIGRVMLNLLQPTGGSVRFEGKDIYSVSRKEMTDLRRDMQIIFQDPFASLDPRKSIIDSVCEGLHIHRIGKPKERIETALEMLSKVGLNESYAYRFPHEFSGGQRQRIGIARVFVLRPKFIVCDEPVSALDVSIQSQILNLLKSLQNEFSLAYLFVAHDLSVVEHISNRVAVMYLGKLVEIADRGSLFSNPLHPYTQALLSAVSIVNPKKRKRRIILKGDLPSPLNRPPGCAFNTRCPRVMDICRKEEPELLEVSSEHYAACWLLSHS